MARKKRINKKLPYSIMNLMYLSFISILLYITYTNFNFIPIKMEVITLLVLITAIISFIIGFNYNKKNKKLKKIFEATKGIIIALPILIIVLLACSFIYNRIENNKKLEENERLFENYDYFIDFNSLEDGYDYRIDPITKHLFYMDSIELKEIAPTYFHKLNRNPLFETYYFLKGYVIINNGQTYFSKELSNNSPVYPLEVPLDQIKNNFKENDYYKINKKDYNFINDSYASNQENEKLFLYKKYNDIFYTKEKLYDLKIQMQNNFELFQEAEYKENYIIVPIDNHKYKINFTFDNNLEVIYTKEELE
ncbi:MAG: hypothetical protein RR500_02450 [Bacilli bacterium]